MQSNHVLEILPAYALGILTSEEQQAVDGHLAGCQQCQTELRAYRMTVARLPEGLPQRMPPARLREKILQRAGQTQNAPAARPVAAGGFGAWLVNLVRPLARPGFALVMLLLIAALGVSNVLLWRQVQAQQNASQVAQKPVVIEMTVLGESETGAVAPGGGGVLVIHAGGAYGTLVVDGMPTLPEEQQYQLWLVNGEQRSSGGVFSVRENGYGYLEVNGPNSLLTYEGFGVTIEPAGGSPAPTGARVLAAELSSGYQYR